MSEPVIGVNVDDFRRGTKEALRLAASLDFHAIELATVQGDVAPRNLTSSGRRHLAHFVDGLGLQMTSLVADTPGLRLTDPQTVAERVERTCQILELAADLKVPVVTASAGAITHPDTGEASPLALEALRRIGEFADTRGTIYAIRPSYEAGDRLVHVLTGLACPSIGVGLDPAAMVMTGANPMARIEQFIEQVVAVQARDGTVGGAERTGHEAPLGEGDVDWTTLLAVLSAAEYRRPYVLRRSESANPVKDIQYARDTLAQMLPPA
ncbi:MAG: sugar phosphate isomerase/epimerase family protein [Planctomycetota bacterium]|jgi:sugar phosphate isomerase/epimerase